MRSASQIVYSVCGSPAVDGCAEHDAEPCWLCAGESTCGVPVDKWNGSSFTGQNRVRCPHSEHVCRACVFVCSRTSPVPGRPAKEGKKFGGNFRNYSTLWEDGHGYQNASKGEKPRILEFLRRDHSAQWFGAIADSGQKHVIPWAPINGPGRSGVVLFDEQPIRVPDSLRLVDDMTALLTAGATKDELGSGIITARAWQLCGDRLREFEDRSGQLRGGGWFALALWLAQRDEEQVQRRLAAEKEANKNARRSAKGTAAKPDRRGAASAARGVPEDSAVQRPEALGHDPKPDAERFQDMRDPGRVGDADRSEAPDRNARPGQLSMFEGPGGRGPGA